MEYVEKVVWHIMHARSLSSANRDPPCTIFFMYVLYLIRSFFHAFLVVSTAVTGAVTASD